MRDRRVREKGAADCNQKMEDTRRSAALLRLRVSDLASLLARLAPGRKRRRADHVSGWRCDEEEERKEGEKGKREGRIDRQILIGGVAKKTSK